MAAEYGFVKPSYVVCANPAKIALIREFEVETATGMYAGALVKKGSTTAEVVVNDTSANVLSIVGWLGYEQASMDDRPATIDTIYTVGSAPVINGPGMIIRAILASKATQAAVVGTRLAPAARYGQLDIGSTGAVAIALEDVTNSTPVNAAGKTIWVMSLI